MRGGKQKALHKTKTFYFFERTLVFFIFQNSVESRNSTILNTIFGVALRIFAFCEHALKAMHVKDGKQQIPTMSLFFMLSFSEVKKKIKKNL